MRRPEPVPNAASVRGSPDPPRRSRGLRLRFGLLALLAVLWVPLLGSVASAQDSGQPVPPTPVSVLGVSGTRDRPAAGAADDPDSARSGNLARTGSEIWPPVAAGTGLTVAGAVLVVLGRRRQQQRTAV